MPLRSRRNPVVTPSEVFSDVLAELTESDPDLAHYAYTNSAYFLAFVKNYIGDRGRGSEAEQIGRIEATGRGATATEKQQARDCTGAFNYPQGTPGALIARYLDWRDAQGSDRERFMLNEAADVMHQHGFTAKDPFDVTVADLIAAVGYPECDDAPSPRVAAYVRFLQSDWMRRAYARIAGMGADVGHTPSAPPPPSPLPWAPRRRGLKPRQLD